MRIKNQIKQYAIKASDVLGNKIKKKDTYYILVLQVDNYGNLFTNYRCVCDDCVTDGFKFDSEADIEKLLDNVADDDLIFYMLNCY